ncbi:hypothetical protein ACHHYP_15046 [Achlya hypogyna]|uniref:Uncharacterized protein n=1 Tax=Achlya hypogyna TaxID=1202772 RepID=A0A1V9YBV0_ACHHY|nr:hypothetical protein ACHHYP_15046 [Achlya hypogyna]
MVAGSNHPSVVAPDASTPWFVKKEFALSPLVISAPTVDAKLPALSADLKLSSPTFLTLANQTRQLQRELAEAQATIRALTLEKEAAVSTIAALRTANAAQSTAIQQLTAMHATSIQKLEARAKAAEQQVLLEAASGLSSRMALFDLDLELLRLRAAHEDKCTQLELSNAKLLRDVAFFMEQRAELLDEKDVHETVIRTLHARMSYFKARMLELQAQVLLLTYVPDEPAPAVLPAPATALVPKPKTKTRTLRRSAQMRMYSSKVVASLVKEAAWYLSYTQTLEAKRKQQQRKSRSTRRLKSRLLALLPSPTCEHPVSVLV